MRFLQKYNQTISLIFKNTIFTLIILLLINSFNVIDITSLMPMGYYWTILLYIFSFYFISCYYSTTKNIQKRINTVTQYIFLTVLFLTALNQINFVAQTQLRFLLPFENMSIYLNHLLFISGASLIFFNRNTLGDIKKEGNEKEVDWYKIAFFLIIILYLVIHLSMFRYEGGYADEFRHILSGRTLIEDGTFPTLNIYFGDQGYVRGAPMSYLVAFFFLVFGYSINIAKMVPITLGLINLFLLNSISKYFIKDKIIRILSLLLFVCSSWLIFMHFYIRHYVFLEFSFVLTVFLFIQIVKNLSNKYRLLLYTGLLILINAVNYFLMYDPIGYIIPFASLFGFLYIFLYRTQLIETKSDIVKKILYLKDLHKVILLIILGLLLLIILSRSINFNSLVLNLLHGRTNTKTTHYNFHTFFLGLYLFFTIFLGFGTLGSIFFKENGKLLFFLLVPPMLLHLISSTSLQIMRGMVYLLPIYYVGVCYGFEKLKNINDKSFGRVTIVILLTLSSVAILNQDRLIVFSRGYPAYPRELGYDEFEPMYDYVRDNLDKYLIIKTDYNNQVEDIYDIKTDYKVDFKNATMKGYSMYFDEEESIWKQFYTDTPTIVRREEFDNIISDNNVCIILRGYADHFLENSDIYRIRKNFELRKSFVGYDIYCRDL